MYCSAWLRFATKRNHLFLQMIAACDLHKGVYNCLSKVCRQGVALEVSELHSHLVMNPYIQIQ